MSIKPADKLVKVDPGRGWGPAPYIITVWGVRECRIKPIDGGPESTIYTAHLYRDAECIRREKVWLADRAMKIGRK